MGVNRLRIAGSFGVACVCAVALLASPVAAGVDAHGWPGDGLVARWSGEGNARDSAGENHGKVVGPVMYVPGVSGRAFKLDGTSAHIDMGNPTALQITGNLTIAMWLNPGKLGVRQNPLSKAVGGEGTVNIENNGQMNFFYGISGGRRVPYTALITNPVLKVGRWTHVALVRDFKAGKITWYINGVMNRQGPTKFGKAKASSQPLYIGKGYVNNYSGLIDEVGIWNRALSPGEIARVAKSGLVGQMATTASEIGRGALRDRIVLDDGKILKGVIGNDAYEVTTFFGKIRVPATDVIGLVPTGSKLKLILADGQVLAGESSQTSLSLDLALSTGPPLNIPLARIRQCGYHITKAKPASATSSGPMVALRGGQWLALAPDAAPTLHLKTPYAKVVLPPEKLLRIEPARDANGQHRAVLIGGSTLTGTLASQEFRLKLALDYVVTVRPGDAFGLSGTAQAEAPAKATVMTMRNGDLLVGTLTHTTLTVRTDYGPVKVFPISILTATFDAANHDAVVMKMWNGSTLRGCLVEKALAFATASGGPRMEIAIAHIGSLRRPHALPEPGTAAKVEKLIAQLGAKSYKDRQAATKELVEMGKTIAPLLRKHVNDTDPEVRHRIRDILGQLNAK